MTTVWRFAVEKGKMRGISTARKEDEWIEDSGEFLRFEESGPFLWLRSPGRLSVSREPRHDACLTRRALTTYRLVPSGEGCRHRAPASVCPTASHANMFTNASRCLATLRSAPSRCPRRVAFTTGTINSKASNRSNFHSSPTQRQECDTPSDSRVPREPPSQDVRKVFTGKPGYRKKELAVVALGSNMGDRVAMIERACREMESSGKIKIVRTSSLWESKAMYVLDQDNFVNGACQVC